MGTAAPTGAQHQEHQCDWGAATPVPAPDPRKPQQGEPQNHNHPLPQRAPALATSSVTAGRSWRCLSRQASHPTAGRSSAHPALSQILPPPLTSPPSLQANPAWLSSQADPQILWAGSGLIPFIPCPTTSPLAPCKGSGRSPERSPWSGTQQGTFKPLKREVAVKKITITAKKIIISGLVWLFWLCLIAY